MSYLLAKKRKKEGAIEVEGDDQLYNIPFGNLWTEQYLILVSSVTSIKALFIMGKYRIMRFPLTNLRQFG